ncbi:MAG: sigma-70 family RNA polymerase sigma factor [Planctomycetes bacterium]|nr:sigma-70 family RNA polymerase sigma factor [Planctomycetota bacterium]
MLHRQKPVRSLQLRMHGEPPTPSEDPPAGRPGGATGEDEDHNLVRFSQAGDERAFQALVEKYEGRAYWIAYAVVQNAEDARDIAQEAFLRVYRSLERFDFDYKFYTWLYQIVTNLSIDHLRRAGGNRAVSLDVVGEVASRDGSPARRLERAERRRAVESVLASLPAKHRAIIVLRDIEGLSAKEISRILQCNHATVRWRLHRARSLFREVWESRYGPE